ncbi:MAG TPA: hypothetical protein DEB37_06920 [Lysinibacillus sp.]|nr:hypothetical protein [Lysinibacillus sp.]
MVVISTIVIIVFGCIGLANIFDNSKQNSEQKLERDKDDDKVYFSGWWKVALVALLLMFLINACDRGIKSDFIPGDWNFDGKVDGKDFETFIIWKMKQEENK